MCLMVELEWVTRVDGDYAPYFQGVLWVQDTAVRVFCNGVRDTDVVELGLPTPAAQPACFAWSGRPVPPVRSLSGGAGLAFSLARVPYPATSKCC